MKQWVRKRIRMQNYERIPNVTVSGGSNVSLTGYQLTLYPEILGHVAISLAIYIIGME